MPFAGGSDKPAKTRGGSGRRSTRLLGSVPNNTTKWLAGPRRFFFSPGRRMDCIVAMAVALTLLPETLVRLEHLWKTGAAVSPVSSEDVLRDCCGLLAELLDATDCKWLAAAHGRTPQNSFSMRVFDNWWAVDYRNFNPGADPQAIQTAYLDYARSYGEGHDAMALHVTSHAGRTRAHLRSEVHDDEDWNESPLVKHYLKPVMKVGERMHAIYSVAPGMESYFLFDRPVGATPFCERERDLAVLALSGLAGLQRALFLERGLIAPARKPLAPREREVLKWLCTDLSEKEIAERVGVSRGTVHQYVTGLIRCFGVRGRAGLMALFTSPRPSAPDQLSASASS